MAATLLNTIIERARYILQETTPDGTRWSRTELLGWLNESYAAIVQVKPDANTANADHELQEGTRQQVPHDGLRLLDVVRNVDGMAITVIDRHQLDTTNRYWHTLDAEDQVQHYTYDEKDPTRFYVYPPATSNAAVELIYSKVPGDHAVEALEDAEAVININDAFAPVMLDYMLYRAYSKDSDDGGNMGRAMSHYQAFMESLGRKVQVDLAHSPNAGKPAL